ncbi:hypothetical protein AS149_37030 [Burkholderia cenocepacia]|nr:hypothetical protein AS149_37030 [Burkholderia cenocepacia]
MAVECFIAHVNSVMNDSERRTQCRCDPAVGSFWQVAVSPIALDAVSVLELQRAFEDAGWPQVQVVYWKDKCSVSLAEHNRHNFGVAMYNGRKATEAMELEAEARRRDEQTRLREFAFAA